MRGAVIAGVLAACISAGCIGLMAQEPDQKDAEIAELRRQLAAKPDQTPEQKLAALRASYAAVFAQGRERGQAACRAAGGKKFVVTIDSAGKAGASCEF